MSVGFTPGPWFADVTITRLSAIQAVARPSDNLLVVRDSLRHWLAVPLGGGRKGDEVTANANLIASAPELYEALRETAECLEHLANKHNSDWDDVLDEARAALRKARGDLINPSEQVKP